MDDGKGGLSNVIKMGKQIMGMYTQKHIKRPSLKIENNVSLIEEKRYQLNHKEADIKKLDYYYQQFISWADEFDNASAERKRMILCTLFKEITIGKGYKIELLMDNSYEQFIA